MKLGVAVLTSLFALHPISAAAAPAAQAGSEIAKDDSRWLSRCVKQAQDAGEGGTLGWGHCMVEHRDALKTAQGRLAAEIGTSLAGKGPDGTDYKAAAAEFGEAQRHWKAFVDADCTLVDDVFGTGTAQGLAGEDCVIAHYAARNAQLRKFRNDYLND